MVMDWQTHSLPDVPFTLSGIAAGIFLICVRAIFLGPGEDAVHLNTSHSLPICFRLCRFRSRAIRN